jgi:hypothetical protein
MSKYKSGGLEIKWNTSAFYADDDDDDDVLGASIHTYYKEKQKLY